MPLVDHTSTSLAEAPATTRAASRQRKAAAQTTCVPGVILLILLQTFAPIAQAQQPVSADIEPPVIELQETPEGIAGESQVFTALVIDDQSLLDVKLYYRYTGQSPFTSVTMQALSDTGFYTATIGTDSEETRAIEYYLQARDQGGNRTVHGYAFDPLIRTLGASLAGDSPLSRTEATADNSTAESSSGSGVKWWHIALGVLAAGALAGLVSGSGDDGGGSDPSVPVTLTVSPPGS